MNEEQNRTMMEIVFIRYYLTERHRFTHMQEWLGKKGLPPMISPEEVS